MNALVLKRTINYPELIAYWTTNTFGDQLIQFSFERLDGSMEYSYATMFEGEHVFSVKGLLEAYKYANR